MSHSQPVYTPSPASDDPCYPVFIAFLICGSLGVLCLWCCLSGAEQERRSTEQPKQKEVRFPALYYSLLPNSYPHKICPFCRVEFQQNDICIQLYCLHLLHDDCFESWSKESDNCPECDMNMTPAGIEQHKKQCSDLQKAAAESRQQCLESHTEAVSLGVSSSTEVGALQAPPPQIQVVYACDPLCKYGVSRFALDSFAHYNCQRAHKLQY